MVKIKKTIFVGLTGIVGMLLTLAGVNLIQISPLLILYTGIGLLILAILLYFFY